MRCPICKEKISELESVCPNCKTNFDEYEAYKEKHKKKESRTNADKLNVFAYINLILSIIGSICIWINFSTTETIRISKYSLETYTDTVVNWYGLTGGIAVLISGFTLFFLLKTVADIYWELEKQLNL